MTKKLLPTLLLALLVVLAPSLWAQNIMLPDVSIQNLPKDVEAYRTMRDQIATTPEGGAAMAVVALQMYSVNQAEGYKAIIAHTDRSRLYEGSEGYKGFILGRSDLSLLQRQYDKLAYIMRSYFKGATPDNKYDIGSGPYTFELRSGKYAGDPETGTTKVWVLCSGASTPRPVTLVRNNRGIWKMKEWSSLIVGVVPPKEVVDDDL